MTDEEFNPEGGEEAIEDLEAPASVQGGVAGGEGCGTPSLICNDKTCAYTEANCTKMSQKVVVWEQ